MSQTAFRQGPVETTYSATSSSRPSFMSLATFAAKLAASWSIRTISSGLQSHLGNSPRYAGEDPFAGCELAGKGLVAEAGEGPVVASELAGKVPAGEAWGTGTLELDFPLQPEPIRINTAARIVSVFIVCPFMFPASAYYPNITRHSTRFSPNDSNNFLKSRCCGIAIELPSKDFNSLDALFRGA